MEHTEGHRNGRMSYRLAVTQLVHVLAQQEKKSIGFVTRWGRGLDRGQHASLMQRFP
jgi:hypothetical protein